MATFDQRRDSTGKLVYRVRIRLKGHQTQTATFNRLSQARKWAKVTESAILEGRYFKTTEAKRRTLNEAIDRYTTEILPTKRPSTIYNQQYHFRWWKSQLGHYVLSDISPPLLVEYRAKLASGEVKPRGSATINRYMAALGHVLSTAVNQWYWLDENPMRKINKLKEPRGRVRFLNDDERQRLLKACQSSKNPYLERVAQNRYELNT